MKEVFKLVRNLSPFSLFTCCLTLVELPSSLCHTFSICKVFVIIPDRVVVRIK